MLFNGKILLYIFPVFLNGPTASGQYHRLPDIFLRDPLKVEEIFGGKTKLSRFIIIFCIK
jgi:hypothetical protein